MWKKQFFFIVKAIASGTIVYPLQTKKDITIRGVKGVE